MGEKQSDTKEKMKESPAQDFYQEIVDKRNTDEHAKRHFVLLKTIASQPGIQKKLEGVLTSWFTQSYPFPGEAPGVFGRNFPAKYVPAVKKLTHELRPFAGEVKRPKEVVIAELLEVAAASIAHMDRSGRKSVAKEPYESLIRRALDTVFYDIDRLDPAGGNRATVDQLQKDIWRFGITREIEANKAKSKAEKPAE